MKRRAEGGRWQKEDGHVREEKDGGGMETKGKGTVKEKRVTETCGFHCKDCFNIGFHPRCFPDDIAVALEFY